MQRNVLRGCCLAKTGRLAKEEAKGLPMLVTIATIRDTAINIINTINITICHLILRGQSKENHISPKTPPLPSPPPPLLIQFKQQMK